jgi:antitoxin FitA
MPTITVKNVPSELYAHLKQAAELNRRSINSEIIVCIERSLKSRRVDPEAVLARARLLRERTAAHVVTDEEFTAAKTEGRP